ncbi:MAG: di-trans,poly-cis-decaprenylcistransferase [Planctomycetes bacterium]|nr:di-trans,poly-cis-decaprenylcistransferase [Planctomycetota bacterium]
MTVNQVGSAPAAGAGAAAGRAAIPEARLPRHVAIIMDGNGRWAKRRGEARVKGHEAGVESVRAITRECARRHRERLTLYAFSAENWRRPKEEVDFLMGMLARFLVEERGEIMENGVVLRAIGREEGLPGFVRRELDLTREMSQGNGGMVLSLALNYGARAEIVDAARSLARQARAGMVAPDEITEEVFAAHLYDAPHADPDLLIRTGGERRLSNFLLWQVSYAEVYVTETAWPEFREPQLWEAFEWYAGRRRTFGGVAVEPGERRA